MRGVLTEKSRAILEARYLHIYDNGNKESINGLFKRVSGGNELYEQLMKSFDFMPNSPTLFNAHTGKKGTLSACVPAGEVICLNNKPVLVEDVVVGDDSLTHNGNVQQVAEVYSREYIGDVVVLTPYYLPTLRLTPEHPVWARRSGRWANGHVSLEMAEPEWIHVGCLEPGDFVFMPTTRGQVVVDSDVAWLIGLYAADGYQPAENATIFCLNKNKDQKIADRVEQISRTFDVTTITRKERDNRLDVYIGSRNLAAYIRTLVQGKVGDKRLTVQAEGFTSECAASLIAGWQAGDGCASHSGGRGNIGATISKTLAWQLRNLSLRTAKPLSLLIRKTRGHSKTAYLLIETPPKNIRKAEDGSGYWVRLRKVRREEYAGVVYNFEVPGDHSYTAGGIAVHNCFKFDVSDSFDEGPDSIFATRRKAGLIAKWGGGVGYYLGNIRMKNSLISTVHRKACGPVAVFRDYQQLSDLITQGGKRALAQMAILPCWHGDIREFIHVKDEDPKKYCSFNISVSWIDKWMQEIKQGRPGEPLKLWEEQIDSAWKTGDPGVYFFDTSEKANPTPWLGQLTGTNPCGEVSLLNNEPCLTGDALVDTPSGLVPIRQLLGRGEFAVNTYEQIAVAGCRAVTRGVKDTLRIVLDNGQTIRCTPNHKILTGGKYKTAQATALKLTKWKTAEEINVGDWIRISDKPTVIPLQRESLQDEMLGWLVGDGWHTQENQIGILFAEDDKEAMERLMPVWDEFVERDYALQRQPTGVVQKACYKTAILEKFKSLGFKTGNATRKELPDYIFQAETYRQTAFLKGLFSADGCVKKAGAGLRNLITLSSSSRRLLEQVQVLLLRFGIQSRIQWTTFSSCDRNDQGQLQISGESALRYRDVIGFNLSAKNNAFEQGQRHNVNREFAKVIYIEPGEPEEVFDILMPERHHFLANGIVVHNCNLGSINLGNFVTKNREVDWTRLEDVARLATRFLDDILDWNHFPVQEIHDAAYRTRKLGLGVMGWSDMLCLLHMHYDSQAAVDLAHRVMQFIDDVAYHTSLQLAKEKGPYPGYLADQATTPPIRNATRTCIAPTGTIYIICGADGSGIEPHFELEWDRKTGEGIILHEKVNAIEESGGFIPKVANDIAVEWHIKHQAAFQKHTNLAVSKTINLPHNATRQDVANAYMMMWESGCKGGTIYRDRCREDQVLVKTGEHKQGAGYDTKSGANSNGATLPDPNKAAGGVVAQVYHPEALAEAINSLSPEGLSVMAAKLNQEPAALLVRRILKEWKGNPILVELATDRVRRKLPVDRQSITHKFHIVDFEGYLTIGLYDDGSPGEIFFKASKEGSTISGLLDSWAMAVSLSLQYGCPLDTLVRLNYGTIFEPRGITCNKDIPLCSSIADYVFRYMSNRFLHGGEKVKMSVPTTEPAAFVTNDGGGKLVLQAQATAVKKRAIKSGVFCPECHAECIYQGGCYECGNRCGFSRCG